MGARWTIGLVGDAGGGKSTVRAWLAARGAATLDGDAVVHRLLASDPALIDAIGTRFGEAVRAAAGGIDRSALAAIVFEDPAALVDLEQLVHPAVLAYARGWLAGVAGDVAVIEAIKLVESGLAAELDALWLVTCEARARRARLAQRGWSNAEIDARAAAAPAFASRLALANVVIDNSGTREATERQLEAAWASVARAVAGRNVAGDEGRNRSERR